MLQRMSKIATEHGVDIYLVGGTVRDVLADVPHLDLDIMTSSGVPSLPQTIAERLRGEVKKTTEFGTATLAIGAIEVDLATARREVYQRPGTLPTVSPSTVEEDLARRDFSVNAMAISLSKRSWGDLLDPHGGLRDLDDGLIRVLHDTSFRDDATRILRAIRYACREDRSLEPHTEQLIKQDMKYLETISGDRVRHELERIFHEPRMAATLIAADEMGILYAIHPALGLTSSILSKLSNLLNNPTGENDLRILALLVQSVSTDQTNSLIERLNMDSMWARVVRDIGTVREHAAQLTDGAVKRSRVYQLLQGLDTIALESSAQSATDPTLARLLRLYLDELQHVQPLLDGDDLIGIGMPEGPMVGRLLKQLLEARLDGLVSTREDEEVLVLEEHQR